MNVKNIFRDANRSLLTQSVAAAFAGMLFFFSWTGGIVPPASAATFDSASNFYIQKQALKPAVNRVGNNQSLDQWYKMTATAPYTEDEFQQKFNLIDLPGKQMNPGVIQVSSSKQLQGADFGVMMPGLNNQYQAVTAFVFLVFGSLGRSYAKKQVKTQQN